MTPDNALLTLIAEMRVQMADADTQRDEALAHLKQAAADLETANAQNQRLEELLAERDKTITELHEHVRGLERAGANHGVA